MTISASFSLYLLFFCEESLAGAEHGIAFLLRLTGEQADFALLLGERGSGPQSIAEIVSCGGVD